MLKTVKFGYCNSHKKEVDIEIFETECCWSCKYFQKGQDFDLMDVKEAKEIFNVSASTIRTWIKRGKLDGKLFERNNSKLEPKYPTKKWYITKASINAYKCTRASLDAFF